MVEVRNDKFRREFANLVRRVRYMNKPNWLKYVLPTLLFASSATLGIRHIYAERNLNGYKPSPTQQVIIQERNPLETLIIETPTTIPIRNLEDMIDRPSEVSELEWIELKKIYTEYQELPHTDPDELKALIDVEDMHGLSTFRPDSSFVYTFVTTKDDFFDGHLRLAFVGDEVIMQYDPIEGEELYLSVPGNAAKSLIAARDNGAGGNALRESVKDYILNGNFAVILDDKIIITDPSMDLYDIMERPADIGVHEWEELSYLYTDSYNKPSSGLNTLNERIDANDISVAYSSEEEEQSHVYTYFAYQNESFTGFLRLAFFNDEVILQHYQDVENITYYSLPQESASILANARNEGADKDTLKDMLKNFILLEKQYEINKNAEKPAEMPIAQWITFAELYQRNYDNNTIEDLDKLSELVDTENLQLADSISYESLSYFEYDNGVKILVLENEIIIEYCGTNNIPTHFRVTGDAEKIIRNNGPEMLDNLIDFVTQETPKEEPAPTPVPTAPVLFSSLEAVMEKPEDTSDSGWNELEQIYEEYNRASLLDFSTITQHIDFNEIWGFSSYDPDNPLVYTYATGYGENHSGHIRIAFVGYDTILQYDPIDGETIYFEVPADLSELLRKSNKTNMSKTLIRYQKTEEAGIPIGYANNNSFIELYPNATELNVRYAWNRVGEEGEYIFKFEIIGEGNSQDEYKLVVDDNDITLYKIDDYYSEGDRVILSETEEILFFGSTTRYREYVEGGRQQWQVLVGDEQAHILQDAINRMLEYR